jgi:hypothetical protein
MVIGGKGVRGQVVVVVRREGAGGGHCDLSCGGSQAVTIIVVGEGAEVVGEGAEVVGEGAEVVGEGARWLEWGWGVVVIVVGEGLGVGWLLEVREVGWGGVIVVVVGEGMG